MFHVAFGDTEVGCDTADEVRSLLNGKGHARSTSNGAEAPLRKYKKRRKRKQTAEAPGTGETTEPGTTKETSGANPEVPYTKKKLSWNVVEQIAKKIGWTGDKRQLRTALKQRQLAEAK